MKRTNSWKGISLATFSLLLTGQLWAQSDCDLVVKSSSQTGDTLSFDLYSSKANLNPYKVTLTQVGKVQSSWASVPHRSGELLKVDGVVGVGVATIKIQST